MNKTLIASTLILLSSSIALADAYNDKAKIEKTAEEAVRDFEQQLLDEPTAAGPTDPMKNIQNKVSEADMASEQLMEDATQGTEQVMKDASQVSEEQTKRIRTTLEN